MAVSMELKIELNDSKKFIENHIAMRDHAIEKNYNHSILWISGSPGIGKSDVFEQICKEHGWGLNVAYVATMLLEQITGLPQVGGYNPALTWLSELVKKLKSLSWFGKTIDLPEVNAPRDSLYTKWSLPELFSFKNLRVRPKDPDKSPMILLLDDAHLCNKTIQGYLFQLLTYRSIHNHKLPDNVSIIMAGNRADDKAGFQQILAPVANRIFFLDVDSNVDAWTKNFAIPRGLRQDIISFMQYYPTYLQSTPLESRAWASPRSWTNAAYTLDEYEKSSGNTRMDNGSIFQILKGHVGDDYATKFIEYRTLLMQWDAEGILLGRTKVDWNDFIKNKVKAYSCITAVTNELIKKMRPKNFKVTKEDKDILDGYRHVIEKMTNVARPIVPLGLKLLIYEEKEKGSVDFTRKVLKGNPVLKELAKVI